ncbi:MAG: His/Gly/Thr/Pro-type tRNA ligase C-terminal domain-containing protein, partial [Planctomycetota bacterium]
EVLVVPTNMKEPGLVAAAEKIYNELTAGGLDVLMDDRDLRAGVKFKDADLIGVPLQVTVGEKGMKAGTVEIKKRGERDRVAVPAGEVVAKVMASRSAERQTHSSEF